MFIPDNMAVRTHEWGKPLNEITMNYSIHKVSFLKFIASSSFLKILEYSSDNSK